MKIDYQFTRKLRQIVRRALGLLPTPCKAAFCRMMIHTDLNPPPHLIFKVAETRDEFEQAFELLYNSYLKEGFNKPDPCGLRVTIYHALPSTTVLIAKNEDRVVGTVSLICRKGLPLPLEAHFDLSSYAKEGSEIIEISSLAIAPEFRGRRTTLLLLLCKFIFSYCARHLEPRYLTIAVNPRQTDFFEQILLFERLSQKIVKSYAFANGAQAVGEILDLQKAHDKALKIYANKPAKKNIFAFFTETRDLPNFRYPEKPYYERLNSAMNPEFMNYFFNIRTSFFKTLNAAQVNKLHAIYALSAEHRAVLPPVTQKLTSQMDLSGLTAFAYQSIDETGARPKHMRNM